MGAKGSRLSSLGGSMPPSHGFPSGEPFFLLTVLVWDQVDFKWQAEADMFFIISLVVNMNRGAERLQASTPTHYVHHVCAIDDSD